VAASGHGHTYTLSARGRGRQFSTRTLKPRLRCPKYVVRRLSPPNRIHGTRRFVDRQHLRYRDSAQAASSLAADVEIADVPLALSLMRQLLELHTQTGRFTQFVLTIPGNLGTTDSHESTLRSYSFAQYTPHSKPANTVGHFALCPNESVHGCKCTYTTEA
jgi:hypothetical protein